MKWLSLRYYTEITLTILYQQHNFMKKNYLVIALMAMFATSVVAQPAHEKYVDYAADGVEWSTAYNV